MVAVPVRASDAPESVRTLPVMTRSPLLLLNAPPVTSRKPMPHWMLVVPFTVQESGTPVSS